MLACGEREAMVMAPLPMDDSAVSPCFHGCPAFFHRHVPPWSPLPSPRSVSPQSTAALTLRLLHIPQTPTPSHCTFQGPLILVCGRIFLTEESNPCLLHWQADSLLLSSRGSPLMFLIRCFLYLFYKKIWNELSSTITESGNPKMAFRYLFFGKLCFSKWAPRRVFDFPGLALRLH